MMPSTSSSRSARPFAEYETMLTAFRCQDLANLLAWANQSKNGRKQELHERCLLLLHKGHTDFQRKIKEIYNQINAQRPLTETYISSSSMNTRQHIAPGGASYGSSTAGVLPTPSSAWGMVNPYANNQQQYYPSSGVQQQQQPLISQSRFNPTATTSNMYQHNMSKMMPSTIAHQQQRSSSYHHNTQHQQQQQQHIDFEKLTFFRYLHEITTPQRLTHTPTSHTQHQHMMGQPPRPTLSYSFTFTLTPEQANLVCQSRSMSSSGSRVDYQKQLHLRFGWYEATKEQVDNLPPNLNIYINGKPATLPTPKPTSKPLSDIIRAGRSIDITSFARLVPHAQNRVEITWTTSAEFPHRSYCIGLYLFQKISVDSLVTQLKEKSVKPPDVTRQMVCRKLQTNGGDDLAIETSTLKASLNCPLIKFRMQLPGRSVRCEHVQCFDVPSYLLMNEKKPTWECPVCDRYVPFDDLMIDQLFVDILKTTSGFEDIVFTPDGQWNKLQEDASSSSSSSSKAVAAAAKEKEACETSILSLSGK